MDGGGEGKRRGPLTDGALDKDKTNNLRPARSFAGLLPRLPDRGNDFQHWNISVVDRTWLKDNLGYLIHFGAEEGQGIFEFFFRCPLSARIPSSILYLRKFALGNLLSMQGERGDMGKRLLDNQ